MFMNRLSIIALTGALLAIAPDAAQTQSAVTFRTRDSAGVRIAINGGAKDSAILLRPSLRIGEVSGGDSAYQFHRLGPMISDRQGTIFAVNGASQSIRVFGADGKFVRQIGRRGQGPGEFSNIERLWFAGDTIVVSERGGLRANLFRKDGTLLTTFDLRMGDTARGDLIAKTSTGWLAWVRPRSREFTSIPAMTLMRDTAELREIDPVSKRVGPLLRKHAGNRRIAQAEVYPAGPLFEPRTLMVYGADGRQYVAVDGQYTIDVYAANGRLERRIIREIPVRPITQRSIQLGRDALPASYARAGSEFATAFERAARYPLAPAFQQLGALMVAPDGSLLIQRIDEVDPYVLESSISYADGSRGAAAAAREESRWERIDPTGRYVGAVRLPAKAVVRYFDGRNIIAVVEDDLGVQYIGRFSLGSRL